MARTAWLLLLGSALVATSRADTLTLAAAQDTTIYSDNATFSNGAGDWMFSGDTGAFYKRRALLRFDVAAAIPPGATITSVELVLFLSKTKPGSQIHKLHRVTSSWGEGASNALFEEGSGVLAETDDATWTHRHWPTTSTWSTSGGDYVATASASTIVGTTLADYTWTTSSGLVADVQGWLDAPATNDGWILIGNEVSSQTSKRFDSRTNPNVAARPRLVVQFTPPACAPPSSYCVAAANSAGPGALIASSGSQSLAANSFTLSVTGAPPSVSGMFLFADGSAQAPLGNGWLCLGGALKRLSVQSTDALGAAQRPLDFALFPASTIPSGSTTNFQFWYRDPAAGGANFNLSDGRAVAFCP